MWYSNLGLAKALVVFPGFPFFLPLKLLPTSHSAGWPTHPSEDGKEISALLTPLLMLPEWSRNVGRGLALPQPFYLSLECCKEISKTIPLLTPNCSEWSGMEAAAACAVYTSCISQTHWESKLWQENCYLSPENNASMGYVRVHSAFAQPFVLGCAWSLKLAHEEFPNSYYGML